ncbi:MAG: acyltransferase family protein, partial [Endozoicomonadaceae bacterium]|nr:acyltransferase family protein [Endozoicomonadaceae bacterium]
MVSYRKELDGLRAVAVIAVILYHAKTSIKTIPFCCGGLFGVDVFFVLSGYLITGIIREQINNNAFSFADFYVRRAKRILPALIVVLTVVSAAAYIILLPEEMIAYVQSLKASLGFYSNYFFYGEDSYTAAASVYKPLLHTWSLSVECQFYLICPAFIWLICKYFKRYLFLLLLALTLLSFFSAVLLAPGYPSKTFYLLPFRAWELLAGGLITFFVPGETAFFRRSVGAGLAKIMPPLGGGLIGYSFLFVDDKAANPSLITLLPVVGTCLIIMFAQKEELITRLLSVRFVVWTGLISYSLYLWHQPVLVFSRLFVFTHGVYPGYKHLLLLIAVCFVCAWLTYSWIEKPFRTRTFAKKKFAFLSVLTALCFSFSVLALEYHGFSSQLRGRIKQINEVSSICQFRKLEDKENPGINFYGNTQSMCNMRRPDTACGFGDKSWVLIGDSFAGQLAPELLQMLKLRGHGLIDFSHEQCPFISADIWIGNQAICPVVNEMRWKEINKFMDRKNIIIAANYDLFSAVKKRVENPVDAYKKGFTGGETVDPELAWKSYAENIIELLNRGHTVYVVYPYTACGTQDLLKPLRGFNKFKSDAKEMNRDIWVYHQKSYEKAFSRSEKLDSYLPDHPKLHKIRVINALYKDKQIKVV